MAKRKRVGKSRMKAQALFWPLLIALLGMAVATPVLMAAERPVDTAVDQGDPAAAPEAETGSKLAVMGQARELIVFPILLVLLVGGMVLGRGADTEF